VVLINLWIPSPPTRAPKHATTTSQRPFHPVVKLGGSCGEGRSDENTEKEREEKAPKKRNKQTNKPKEEATVTNQ
jgi:hypothetical protein